MLVDGGMGTAGVRFEILACGAVPGDTIAVNVLEAVAKGDLRLCSLLAWHMRDQFREVVVMDLVRDGVFWCDEHVFEEAFPRTARCMQNQRHILFSFDET